MIDEKHPKIEGKKSTAEDIQSDFHLAWLTAGEAAEEAIVMWMLVKQRNPPHVFPFWTVRWLFKMFKGQWPHLNTGESRIDKSGHNGQLMRFEKSVE